MFNKVHAFKLIGGEMSESTFMTHILQASSWRIFWQGKKSQMKLPSMLG
jgi:hypothetical protein